ncbi:HEAT repeat domain-containing protein [Burkholderia plantarii]|uniref:HEAT repeat domain-containing protein n=1 Tax=Burkholderia plantarii TaxID=41899 RepID=UPI0018DBEAEC|nr:HEAT repeat domain-containing protein [Burkholderia plantarii]MBI0329403.1 HEAT repeat domain-containing protein [Burkholderia plantarii]
MTTLPAAAALAAADPAAAPLLARAADADPAVRRIALLELADLEDPALVPAFVALLAADPAAEVRREAALALAAWEQPDAVDALCAALLDTGPGVREAAAQSLSELKDPASGDTLRRWAGHHEPFAARAVLRGLRELRHPDAYAPALAALDTADAELRLEAIAVLGWLKVRHALPRLAALAVGDPHPELRRAAVGALGFVPDGEADPADETVAAALLGALADAAWQVREEAATTLGKRRETRAVEALTAALDDAYWQVRLRATRALGRIGARAATPAVAALLAHPIGNLRREAALALGELRDPAALDALHAARDDADPEVRKAVRIALQQIGQADTRE